MNAGNEENLHKYELIKLIFDRHNILAKKLKIKRFNQYNFGGYFAHFSCLWLYVVQIFDTKEEIYNKVNYKYDDYHYQSIKNGSNRHIF